MTITILVIITRKKEISTTRAVHVLDLEVVIRKETEAPYTHIRHSIVLFVPYNIKFNKHIQFLFFCMRDIHDFVK